MLTNVCSSQDLSDECFNLDIYSHTHSRIILFYREKMAKLSERLNFFLSSCAQNGA